ncbi:hypothetical protein J6590_045883, partial [Homalodisca vitripennis]
MSRIEDWNGGTRRAVVAPGACAVSESAQWCRPSCKTHHLSICHHLRSSPGEMSPVSFYLGYWPVRPHPDPCTPLLSTPLSVARLKPPS